AERRRASARRCTRALMFASSLRLVVGEFTMKVTLGVTVGHSTPDPPTVSNRLQLRRAECRRGEVEVFEDALLQRQEARVGAAARAVDLDVVEAVHAPGPAAHDDDAVAQDQRLLDVVGDEDHGRTVLAPDLEEALVLSDRVVV